MGDSQLPLSGFCLFTPDTGMIADSCTHSELAKASHLLPSRPTSLSQVISLGLGGGRVASSLPAWPLVLEWGHTRTVLFWEFI